MSIIDFLISKSNNPHWKEIVQSRITIREMTVKYWSENNLFSLVWWLMIILFIALWFIWWKRVDKTRLHEIITYGLMTIIIALIVDAVGVNFVLWGYPNMIFPLVPPLIITDFCLLPVVYMLTYQYFIAWKSFIFASTILSLTLSYILEPIAVFLDFYQLIKWKHSYSLPMYFILALSLKWVMDKIVTAQSDAKIGKKSRI